MVLTGSNNKIKMERIKIKHCFLLLLATLLAATTYAQRAAFPAGQTLYFTRQGSTVPLKALFYYDRENDAACDISVAGRTASYLLESNSSGQLVFRGFTWGVKYKSVQITPFGMPMMVADGTGKTTNNETATLSADYGTLTLNGTAYNQRISKSRYDQMYETLYGGQAGTVSPGTGLAGGNSDTHVEYHQQENMYTPVRCKNCNGTGRCLRCKGSGIVFNPYSGENDRCPACSGEGRCRVCFGTGRVD